MSAAPMDLTVRYLFNGQVVDEVRTGWRFRWAPLGDGWNVREFSEPGVTVWQKLYRNVIDIELDIPAGARL